jgi:hypothetical protein
MLHACLYTICFVFCYTSWRFYAFSRTNLLTRCHSASSLFSAIFMFQKSYTGNILGIRRNKSRSSYFYQHEMESKAETEGGASRQAHHRVERPTPGPLHQVVWPPGPPPDAALPPIYSPRRENLKGLDQFSLKHTASHRHRRREIGRVQKLFSAPCRKGESPPEAFFITMPASGVMCE